MLELDPDRLIGLRALVRRAAGGLRHTGLPGGFVTRRRGAGLEIAELRAFHTGDDPRHIDRNATARSGKPQVRTFQAERDRTTILLADFRPSMFWGTRRTLRAVAAAEALSLVGWRAVGEGGRVGLVAVSAGDPVFVRPRSRDAGMIGAIGGLVRAYRTALAGIEAPESPLSEALELATRLAPHGATVTLASALDTPGPRLSEAVRALSHRAALSVIRVVDAFEDTPPPRRFRFVTPSGGAGSGSPTRTAPPVLPEGIPLLDLTDYYAALPPERQHDRQRERPSDHA